MQPGEPIQVYPIRVQQLDGPLRERCWLRVVLGLEDGSHSHIALLAVLHKLVTKSF